MKKVLISLTSSVFLAAALAGVAAATEGDYRTGTVAPQGPSPDSINGHTLGASPAAEMIDLELAKLRKPTTRDDRKTGDE